ncbi:unnamed protein product [Macrosiphum euphorbiae]|uniref:Reverse transcriptase domain-containing protein n=1 Tax=Macrosiphum euphorbiae TaxID=13131 RepID=A0AAV0XMU7_9HEMI|nr:unnamed protein product [Macrosiphum euphorbiae]
MAGTSNLTKAQRAMQRAVQRPRFMRDRHLKSITDIHSLAMQVESGVVEKCELDVRIESFETIVSKFRLEQEAVVDVLIMHDCIEQFDEVDEPVSKAVEEMYFNVKHIISRLSKKDFQSTTIAAPTLSALPKIELPKFNGDILSWSLFRDTFLSAVHENPDLSDIRRFQYLLMCVTGSALTIVKTFPLSASNYNLAWGALLNRFNNQRLLATAHVDKLFTFKPIAQESLSALNAFVNVFRENIAAIKELGVKDLVGFILFHLASKALDPATRRSFEISLAPNQMPDFDLLLEFVQQRCKVLENIQGPVRAERAEKNVTTGKSHQASKSFMSTTYDKSVNQKQFKCAFCNEAHTIYRCVAFQKITVEKRRDFVSTNKLCFSCLSTMHMINKCSSKSSCRICQKRHHTLLHLTTSTSNTTQVSDQTNINVGGESTPASTSQVQFSGTSRTNSMVVLGTAVVRVKDSCGVLHSVRVLLDSGSQISAITSSCVSRIGLTKHKCFTEIVGLAQNPVAKIKGVTNCQFIPHHSTKNIFQCSDLFILPLITDVMPTLQLPPCIRKNYEHLLLADPNFDVPAQIDILLGGDIFPNIVRPRADIIHSSGYPSAFDTLLGWVVCGAISQPNSSPAVSLAATLTPSVDNLLRKFWTVEEPAVPALPTTEDQLCEQMFVTTTYRAPCGRFCVALPFRPNAPELGESRALALNRFYNLERKLMKEPQLYTAYRKFMNDYQTLGHMEVARQAGKYFIPHHAVLKADGDISKLRVVFDASARSSSGLSLNDVLYTGPKLQTDIRDILLRIRLHRYIFTADIVKMYRQIMIRPEDRPFQHILWRDSPDEEIKEFELLTVTYGVSSAPYLAIRCLHELDAQEGHRFPLTKGILTDATYVDDIVVGADSEEELLSLQKQIVALLRSGGCELKKWTSNCPLILKQVPSEDCAQQTSFDPKEDHSIKVLGLYWDTDSDYFAYHTRTPEPQLSKRKVLSVIARLFDPIGALGPMLMWAKGFMQKLWHDQLDWDTPLPENLSTAWNQFLMELPTIHQVTLPRYINVQSYSDIQLLGFADASSKGYAATIYLRVVHTSGNVTVHFVSCKTKVAPIKTSQLDESLSIPRLELCAALLLAQSLFHIQEVLSTSIKISQVRAWTDSSIVLSWLSTEQKYFKIFVTHRVVKIHALVPKCHWGHVRTHENPADPASRGLLPTTMASSSLHWNGPEFLTRPEEYWPPSTFTPMPLDDLPETKADTTTVLHVTKVHPSIEPFHRFSSLIKMQRVLAYCIRFSPRSRHRPVLTGPLTRAELNYVLIIAVKETQKIYFSNLWKQLTTSQMITPASLAQLAPFVDNDGLIRVGGRLRYSALNEDAKHPILLPHSAHDGTYKRPVVKLVKLPVDP